MTSVLINKPTIINGAWASLPFILTRTSAGWADRPAPKTQKEQANERSARAV